MAGHIGLRSNQLLNGWLEFLQAPALGEFAIGRRHAQR
jgi:hypothetical protein